jgi:hypothetical protein
MSLVVWPCICERAKSQQPKRLVHVHFADDAPLQMRMNAADRADASLGRLIT